MDELKLEFEWEDPAGAKGRELRATWARLQIEVGGHVLTRLVDAKNGSVRSGVYLPLYPLAEWVATSWWSLLCEPLSPSRTDQKAFRSRHDVICASEGYCLPSVMLEPTPPILAVRWNATDGVGATVRFIESGEAHVGVDQAQQEMERLVWAVIRRLEDNGIRGTYLQDEWQAVQDADEEERAFCRAAAELGVDPYSTDENLTQAIVNCSNMLTPETLWEFNAAANPAKLVDEAKLIVSRAEQLATEAPSAQLRQAKTALSAGARQGIFPWERGYWLATRLRDELGWGKAPTKTVGDLVQKLGVPDSRTTELPPFVQSLLKVDRNEHVGFLVPAGREESTRFSICRSLCDYLVGGMNAVHLATRSQTYSQALNRAFAAELLAPAASLRDELSGTLVSAEEIDELAGHYGVSQLVIQHQVENHNLAHIA
jgi:hypothetical protein